MVEGLLHCGHGTDIIVWSSCCSISPSGSSVGCCNDGSSTCGTSSTGSSGCVSWGCTTVGTVIAVLVPEQILGVAVPLLEVVSQVRVEVQVPARVRARTLVRLQGVISAP